MKSKLKMLETLYLSIKSCEKCRLYNTRNNVVLGEGNPDSRLLIVAQAPGEREDRYSRLLIGPAGEIFNKLLEFANIKRSEIFITNLLKCFLPKYRRPKWDEIYKCKEYLFTEIKIINPEIVVPLGYYSTRVILEYFHFPLPERRNHYHKIFGKVFSRENVKIIPIPHPALIFHDRERKDGIFLAFKKLGEIYKNSWKILNNHLNF